MNEIVTDPNSVMPNLDLETTRLAKAGAIWAARPLAHRLAVIRTARIAIAHHAEALAATIDRPLADTLGAEILPLAAAAHFLVRNARRILRPKRYRTAPPWLLGIHQEIRREPRGVVLILAPGNYPLFLPASQALQALAAGNAVAVKPAPGKSAPMTAFAALMAQAGLPDSLLRILPENAGPAATRAGFDYIVLTGSARTGTAVAHAAADTLTPTAMELSGNDAVFVLPGADLALAASALAYGLRLNAGATCIAPRRVFVPVEIESDLLSRLLALLPPPAAIPPAIAARLSDLLTEAQSHGARIAARNPAVVTHADPTMTLLQEDVFAPWLAFVPVPDMDAALAADALCPYALGATIFGPRAHAEALAARIDAGAICINDVIAPTADPRLPFGGRGQSGFGVTRGAEGLLEMTVVKTVSTRRFGLRPQLDPKLAGDAKTLGAIIRLLHGTDRWTTVKSLWQSRRRAD